MGRHVLHVGDLMKHRVHLWELRGHALQRVVSREKHVFEGLSIVRIAFICAVEGAIWRLPTQHVLCHRKRSAARIGCYVFRVRYVVSSEGVRKLLARAARVVAGLVGRRRGMMMVVVRLEIGGREIMWIRMMRIQHGAVHDSTRVAKPRKRQFSGAHRDRVQRVRRLSPQYAGTDTFAKRIVGSDARHCHSYAKTDYLAPSRIEDRGSRVKGIWASDSVAIRVLFELVHSYYLFIRWCRLGCRPENRIPAMARIHGWSG